METITIKGVMAQVFETVKGVSQAGNEWQKTDFLIENNNQRNNKVFVTCFGQIKPMQKAFFEIGTTVEVTAVVYSNEFNGRFYTNVTMIDIK